MDTTRLDFRVATEGHVVLRIFDVNGRVVRTLVNDNLAPGLHPVNWDGRDDTGRHVASGTYYAQFVAGRVVKNQKVVCLR